MAAHASPVLTAASQVHHELITEEFNAFGAEAGIQHFPRTRVGTLYNIYVNLRSGPRLDSITFGISWGWLIGTGLASGKI